MNLVRAWGSKIEHITDQGNNGHPIKTRCGRTIKSVQYGYLGFTDCARYGTPEEFQSIVQEKREKHMTKEVAEKSAMRLPRSVIGYASALRLRDHQTVMKDFQSMIEERGGEILDVKETSAGGTIKFMRNGLKFKLTGNI